MVHFCWPLTLGSTRPLNNQTEFHASEIFHRKKNFKHFSEIEKRLDIIKNLADMITQEEELSKIYVRIDTSKTYANKKPEEIAFMYFVERVERQLRSQKGDVCTALHFSLF